eukprot:TRINITY_DN3706_c0_g1_i4.p1 TRINITY_DN3706_c0_g1~~TRINITY_DN3706_c0_g1_i4.p1  ORF type:complete len:190 (-),score=37.60 TRINITY_DN3706_c0_g1_i4:1095-1664(-)
MIRRPPRSTLSSSSAASDVYKRQVSTQSTGVTVCCMLLRTAATTLRPATRAFCTTATNPSQYYATGKRKSSVARVWLSTGESSGEVMVNGKPLAQFAQNLQYNEQDVLSPLVLTDMSDHVSVKSTVKGGGTTGQTGALRLGIARALAEMSPEFHRALRQDGMLTRDSRRVERKKPGQKKARKKFQWVKR